MKNNHWGKMLTAALLALMLLAGSMLGAMAEDAVVVADLTAAETEEPVLLASVNGEEIWSNNGEMQALIEYYNNYYSAYYDTGDPAMQSIFRGLGLQWAIESLLYEQKAVELNVVDMTDEQKAKLEADAKEEWEEAVSQYATYLGSLTEESTEEEVAAARADAAAYIQTNFGYTEESFISEYVEGSRPGTKRENVQHAVIGEITVSEEELNAYYNELVEKDRASYENNIPMYEYSTQYMGSQSFYVPEGYRGITHILLDVDDELLKNYTNLAAQLEEQQEKEAADAAANADEAAAETVEAAAEAATETVEETTEAATETVEAAAEAATETVEAAAEAATETVEAAAEAATETAEAAVEEEPKEPVTQEQVDAAKQAILDSVQAQVEEIMAKYEAGTPFADLIAEYGTDPGMTREPSRTNGYSVHAQSVLWDPAFTEGAMALQKVGDVSEPVLGSSGIHILHYTRDIPAGAVELTEELRAQLTEELLSEKESTAVAAMVEEWKKSAEIVYTEEGQAILDAMNEQMGESVETTEATEEVLTDGN